MKPTPKIELHFKVAQGEDQFFTAVCSEFPGLITCEQSLERLMVPMIKDAIIGWFDALKKRGLLPETLRRFDVDPTSQAIDFMPILNLVPSLDDDPAEVRYETVRASA